MKYMLPYLICLCAVTTCLAQQAESYTRQHLDHFERSIRPVLVQHCIGCHGPQRQEGELRLDSRKALLTGGSRGPAIDLVKRGDSLLLKALRHQDGLEMRNQKKKLLYPQLPQIN